MKKMLLLSALVIPGSVFASEVSDGSDISCYEEEYQAIQSYEHIPAPVPVVKQVSKTAAASSFSSQGRKAATKPYFPPKSDEVSAAHQTTPKYNKVMASPYALLNLSFPCLHRGHFQSAGRSSKATPSCSAGS